MAKQNNIFKIKGPLDAYSFYILNGEPVVRGKSGCRRIKSKGIQNIGRLFRMPGTLESPAGQQPDSGS